MIFRIFYKNFLIVFFADVLLLAAAFIGSHLIRFEFDIPIYFLALFKRMLPWVLLTKLSCFYYFGLYRGMWRYTSISDLLKIIKASTIATVVIVSFILFKSSIVSFAIIFLPCCGFLSLLNERGQ